MFWEMEQNGVKAEYILASGAFHLEWASSSDTFCLLSTIHPEWDSSIDTYLPSWCSTKAKVQNCFHSTNPLHCLAPTGNLLCYLESCNKKYYSQSNFPLQEYNKFKNYNQCSRIIAKCKISQNNHIGKFYLKGLRKKHIMNREKLNLKDGQFG